MLELFVCVCAARMNWFHACKRTIVDCREVRGGKRIELTDRRNVDRRKNE